MLFLNLYDAISQWPALADIRTFATTARKKVLPSREDRAQIVPLQITAIEGLNEYNEQRLHEEGIDDIPNLAMADIPRLMVSVRIGGIRILDWVDQALLYTYARQDMDALRALGIRTASALVYAYLGPGNLVDTTLQYWVKLQPNSPHLKNVDEELRKRLYHYLLAVWYHPYFQLIDSLRRRAFTAA